MNSICLHTQPNLTEDIALNAIRDFFREKPFLVFGSGISCALDVRFGMAALQCELLQRFKDFTLDGAQAQQWKQVEQSLQNGTDLGNIARQRHRFKFAS